METLKLIAPSIVLKVPVSLYAGGNFPHLPPSSAVARLRHSSSSYPSRSSAGSPPPRLQTRSVAASFPPAPTPLSAPLSLTAASSSSRAMTLPRKHSSSSFSVG